jgi:protease-4
MMWFVDLLRNTWRLLANGIARAAGPPPEYVVVTLSGSYPERTPPARPFARRVLAPPWERPEESLEALRERLERIAAASGVRGIILRPLDLRAGLAAVQSLRAAVREIRGRGKRVVAYLLDADLQSYSLAVACDEVWMAPAGFWRVAGPRTELTFFRGAFDRVGLLPQYERIAEYKTAADIFTRPGMSEHHREVVESILDGLGSEIVADVAAARRLDQGAVRAAIDRAPLNAADAASAGLIDGVCYEDELPERLGSRERPARLRPWAQAQRRLPRPYLWRARTPTIGVVELIGAIVPGESRESPVPLPLVGRRFAGSDTIARAFRAAERHPGIRAVVFHVESPGGSALASDMIWREVERVKQRKPVVVFMGNVAGSGGYYVSCGASRIIAQASTITGSIGVLAGKITARVLWERLGLNREIVARDQTATMESVFQPFSDDQLGRLRAAIHTIYRRFVGTVAKGRGRAPEEIEAVARGRVWTGRQALERGLVDELGDFVLAVRRASELAGIPPTRRVRTVTVRPPRAAGVPVFGAASAAGAVYGTASGAGAVTQTLEAWRATGALLSEPVLLLMPEAEGIRPG